MRPGAQVAEHVDKEPAAGVVGRRYLADMIEHDPAPQVIGELQGRLGRSNPALEPVGIAVATAGREGDRRDHQPFVTEPLADLPSPCAGDLVRIEPVPGIELDGVHTEVSRHPQALAEVMCQRCNRNGKAGGIHGSSLIVGNRRGDQIPPGEYPLSMAFLPDVLAALDQIAPLRLAAEWDAVGLLVSPRRSEIRRVITCLTLTPEVAAEAVRQEADLVVTHHPLPFRPVGRITSETGTGQVLLDLIGGGVGVWSGHTAWDSAAGGINDQLAAMLSLGQVRPIEPDTKDPAVGFGRVGAAEKTQSLADLARRLSEQLAVSPVQVVGGPDRLAGRVGIVCGSGGDLVAQVAAAGCTTLVTGEIKLHQAAEARAAGMGVIAIGHHASEHFSMAVLGERLAAAIPELEMIVAETDRDPIEWL